MTTIHYCPVCGQPMTHQGNQIDYRTGHEGESYPMLSCKNNPACRMTNATVSLGNTQDDAFYMIWHVERKYDVFTGEELTRD